MDDIDEISGTPPNGDPEEDEENLLISTCDGGQDVYDDREDREGK